MHLKIIQWESYGIELCCHYRDDVSSPKRVCFVDEKISIIRVARPIVFTMATDCFVMVRMLGGGGDSN